MPSDSGGGGSGLLRRTTTAHHQRPASWSPRLSSPSTLTPGTTNLTTTTARRYPRVERPHRLRRPQAGDFQQTLQPGEVYTIEGKDYRVLQTLGGGRRGQVYLARQQDDHQEDVVQGDHQEDVQQPQHQQRLVAIKHQKFTHSRSMDDRAGIRYDFQLSMASFENEIHHLKKSTGRYIGSQMDRKGNKVMVQRYVAGRTLHDRLSSDPSLLQDPMALDQLRRKYSESLRALHHAGTVHGDAWPGNAILMPTPSGRDELVQWVDLEHATTLQSGQSVEALLDIIHAKRRFDQVLSDAKLAHHHRQAGVKV